MDKQKITITFDRSDGSSRAIFDNFDDAILFAEEIRSQQIII